MATASTGLRSTYNKQPLPPGWTEHKAPTGHIYYYNAATLESTYKRPTSDAAFQLRDPSTSFFQYRSVPSLADPATANAFLAQYRQSDKATSSGAASAEKPPLRPVPQPRDRPVAKIAIPGCGPWLLVSTKYGRRFVFNPATNASYWRVPPKLTAGILELDQARIRDKAASLATANAKDDEDAGEPKTTTQQPAGTVEAELDDSEYEEVEVEVTDDEDEARPDVGDVQSAQLREIEKVDGKGPVEFGEDDIAYQLQAMNAAYRADEQGYSDNQPQPWEDDAEDAVLSEEDAKALFQDILDDLNISPYSPWERLLEEGKITEDPRYTVLNTTKARKAAWEEWSMAKVQVIKLKRSQEEKRDPRVAYLVLLQEQATPTLYWPEFKRKFKKEEAMRNMKLADKDKEKLYREHINRLKLPAATLKSDLFALLKAQTLAALNNRTLATGSLPSTILSDLRYISLPPAVRDPLVEAYVQNLGPPPDMADAQSSEDVEREREAKEKRQRALERREAEVRERKMTAEGEERAARRLLRDGQQEL